MDGSVSKTSLGKTKSSDRQELNQNMVSEYSFVIILAVLMLSELFMYWWCTF